MRSWFERFIVFLNYIGLLKFYRLYGVWNYVCKFIKIIIERVKLVF